MRYAFLFCILVSACAPASSGQTLDASNGAAVGAPLVWSVPSGPSARAREFYNFLSRLGEHALDPQRYGISRIAAIFTSQQAADQAELDSLLTRALVDLAVDVRFGRADARAADGDALQMSGTHNPAVRSLQAEALRIADDPGRSAVEFLRALFPQHRQYGKMMQALETYRGFVSSGGWRPVPGGKPIKPGGSDARVPLVAERLRITGDLSAESPPSERYDAGLVLAVEGFQRRHGLKPDGVIGRETFEAMSVSAEDRTRQLAANLERWRWLDRDLGERFIMVNLAGFELLFLRQAGEAPEVLFRTPVIVGKPFQSTPVFSSKIRYVELNPYWNVPKTIETNEILPKERKTPGYMRSEHMTLQKTDGWTRIRQDPGPWNALGAVKFVFPNFYDVYLHDTPSKSLFQATTRTFSHGCIRVKDPLVLAELLLGGEPAGWGPERLAEVVHAGKNTQVPLPQPVPIHILYRTAWVDLDGSINFRPDVYGRDERLIEAIGF